MSRAAPPIEPPKSRSSAPAAAEPAASAPSSAPASLTEVRVDDLIVGRPLSSAVYDNSGVLLLAAGALITSEFKRLLQQRKITSIQVNSADVARVSVTTENFAERNSGGGSMLDSVVAAQLDRVIDSGLLTLQNHGPAFKHEVVSHGRKLYNVDRLDSMRERRAEAAESLNNAMKDALHGRTMSTSVINQLAANFLGDLTEDTDCSLSVALEATRDASLAEHCFKMSMLATAIAVEMGMNEENCRRVCVAGLVHDWGMAKVPAELRNADRVLSRHEFFEIKKHPIYTAEILERAPGIPSLVPLIAYQVHERPNGQGYPRGRTGDRIHILARILGAADAFIALTEEKPYRPPLAPYSAMECLIRMGGARDVDPDVVRAMLKALCLFPIGSLVALDDGSVAQVLRRNGDNYAKPIVQRIQDQDGNAVPKDDASLVDLAEGERGVTQALPTPGRKEVLLTREVLSPLRPNH